MVIPRQERCGRKTRTNEEDYDDCLNTMRGKQFTDRDVIETGFSYFPFKKIQSTFEKGANRQNSPRAAGWVS